MAHVLDRAILHALMTRQSGFAEGTGKARRFLPDVEPFAACVDDSAEALADLAALVPEQGIILTLQVDHQTIPDGLTVAREIQGVQMVAVDLKPPGPCPDLIELGDADAAEMLALAELTKPGPFLPRTHMLGGFVGIRREGQLVAMAGERLKVPGYTEVSGVCTHPDHRGHGYASLLSTIVAGRIRERGETPILHAFASNTAAIRIYEKLGFELRTMVQGLVLKRA